MFPSYRNQSVDLLCKSTDWFLYNGNIGRKGLRQLVKRVLRQCYECKKFHVKSYPVPQKELLPADRTNLDLPFKIIGTDYAGPFLCKSKGKKGKKVYLLLFTCSLSRAIHLKVLPNQTTHEFIHALK